MKYYKEIVILSSLSYSFAKHKQETVDHQWNMAIRTILNVRPCVCLSSFFMCLLYGIVYYSKYNNMLVISQSIRASWYPKSLFLI